MSARVSGEGLARRIDCAAATAGVLASFVMALAAPRAVAQGHDWLEVDARLDAPHAIEASVVGPAAARLAEWTDSGFGAVELAWRTEVELLEGERTRLTQTVARLFVTTAGVQQAGTLEFPVEIARSRFRVTTAYVLLPDGERVPVDPAAVQVTDARVPYLFSDQKNVAIPFHGIVPGAIAIFEYRETRDLSGHPLPWGITLNLRALVPVVSNEISVRSARPSGWLDWSTDDPELACHEGEGLALFCRRGEVEALPVDPAMRSLYDLIPTLVLAERMDWGGLAERVGRLVDDKADLSADMKVTVERTRGRFATNAERARELYRIVANEVRYLGFEHGDSSVVPHLASLTWKRRFGDCKDKVTLFVAMARALGLDARPMLTSVTRFDVRRLQIPAAAWFDHMIVCSDDLEADGGCVDVTVAGAPPELPFALQGGFALDLTRTAPPDALALRDVLWDVEIERGVEIGCDGRLEETVSLRQGGVWGNAVRTGLLSLGPSERSQYARSQYAEAFNVAHGQPEVRIEGLGVLDRPWSFEYATSPPRRVALSEPGHFYDVDAWLIHAARALVSDNRHHDYLMPGLRLESHIRYALCAGVGVEYLGGRLAFASRWGKLTREYSLEDGGVRVDTRLETPSRLITPAEAQDLRLFLERAITQTPIQFGYVPGGVGGGR